MLLPILRSTSIRPEEEALRAVLESIDEDLKRPGGLGRMKGKLSELWTSVGALSAMKERARQSGTEGPTEWAVVDDDGLNELAQVEVNVPRLTSGYSCIGLDFAKRAARPRPPYEYAQVEHGGCGCD